MPRKQAEGMEQSRGCCSWNRSDTMKGAKIHIFFLWLDIFMSRNAIRMVCVLLCVHRRHSMKSFFFSFRSFIFFSFFCPFFIYSALWHSPDSGNETIFANLFYNTLVGEAKQNEEKDKRRRRNHQFESLMCPDIKLKYSRKCDDFNTFSHASNERKIHTEKWISSILLFLVCQFDKRKHFKGKYHRWMQWNHQRRKSHRFFVCHFIRKPLVLIDVSIPNRAHEREKKKHTRKTIQQIGCYEREKRWSNRQWYGMRWK